MQSYSLQCMSSFLDHPVVFIQKFFELTHLPGRYCVGTLVIRQTIDQLRK